MSFKKFLAVILTLVGFHTAFADLPYREHRYDSFMATPPAAEKGKSIVFFGNSITNMHNWNEAFGSDPNVVNRGNSGGFVYELMEEVECLTDSKPAKVFIGIGTNDLSSGRSPEQVTADTRTLIRRIQIASPETEINVQSILPRSNDVWTNIRKTIPMVQAMCEEMGVNFIDLTDTMMGVRTMTGSNAATTWAPDGLHPSGRGYRAWCEFIKDRVNGVCSYSPGEYHSELTTLSNPSRISQFSLLPVDSDDILFVGDEMVENGEWNELLGLPQIKKRSNGYGHGGIGLLGTNGARDLIKVSLTTDPATQKAPAKIFIYCGVNEIASYTYPSTYKNNYQTLINYIHQVAPTTKIYAVSMLSVNSDYYASQYNSYLKQLADADDLVTYVDIYTDMKANAANSMSGNYVNGRGYVRIANLLAPYLKEDGANPVSLEEFETYYANRLNRKAVGIAYNKLYALISNPSLFGDAFGQYPASDLENLENAAKTLEAAIAKGTVTDTEKTQLVNLAEEAMGSINLPTGFDGRYYRLTASRGGNAVTVSNDVINGLANADPATTNGSNVWRFEKRADGTIDIISLSGKYIVPGSGSSTASISVSNSQPANGWKFKASEAVPGTVVIYAEQGSTRTQFNQQSGGSNIWNWYGTTFPNIEDEGCAYYITEFTGQYKAPGQEGEDTLSGWYLIEGATGLEALGTANLMANVDLEWRQNATNSYAFKYCAYDEARPARHFIHVTVKEDGSWYFTSANGHGVQENATSTRASIPSNTIAITEEGDLMQLGKWTSFTGTDYTWHEFPIVGKSSSSNVYHKVAKVDDTQLADYDIWSVEIIGNPATEVINDLKMTLDIAGNKGITTVYNGGTYFLTKGTKVSTSDLTFSGNVSSQTHTTPDVTIDRENHTIVADFTGSTPVQAQGKWYAIKLHSFASGSNASLPTWVNTALNNNTNILQAADREYLQNLNGNYNYYGVGITSAPEADNAARTFFYVVEEKTTSGVNMTVRTINGHYVLDNGCATLTPTPLEFTPGTSEQDVYSTTWCIWMNNNIGAPIDLIGKFSGNSCNYKFDTAETDAYDIYQVEIVGRNPATSVNSDLAVTLTGIKSYGLPSVFNNGFFFVDKGATITPDMITADVKPVAVIITPGKITVSYDEKDAPKVSEITLSQSTAQLEVDAELLLTVNATPAEASLGMVIFTSSNPEVATVTLGGLVKAISAGTAEITATCGDLTATCTVTVEAPTSIIGTLPAATTTVEPLTEALLEAAISAGNVYDLLGRRIATRPAPGFYIINGHKYLLH
ncbi:MAG: hypothetical protein HDS60_00975 [Barnesiella sp.]|nr:hypothetical protein [Barnesiella sp.]